MNATITNPMDPDSGEIPNFHARVIYDEDSPVTGPYYLPAIEYDEDEGLFYVADQIGADGELVNTSTAQLIGDWREVSLWLAKQLLIMSTPLMVASGEDEALSEEREVLPGGIVSPLSNLMLDRKGHYPRRALRKLTADEILARLAEVDEVEVAA